MCGTFCMEAMQAGLQKLKCKKNTDERSESGLFFLAPLPEGSLKVILVTQQQEPRNCWVLAFVELKVQGLKF